MKRIILLLALFLAACGAAPGSALPPTPVPGFEATKLFQLTAEMETATAIAPKNQATVDAILATKAAGGTAAAETMTAEPTLTLTPTIPPTSPDCSAQMLQAVFNGAQGATQSIVFGVNITNTSVQPCFLQQWPQAILADPQGNPLQVTYSYSGPSGATYNSNTLLGLPPGRTANFGFQWGNWCSPVVQAGVSVRLVLAGNGGTLTIPTGLPGGGVCNDTSSPSWVMIFPLELQ